MDEAIGAAGHAARLRRHSQHPEQAVALVVGTLPTHA